MRHRFKELIKMDFIHELNTKKSALLDAQDKVMRASLETKVKLTAAQEESYTNALAEVADIDKMIAKMSAIAAGKAQIAKPTSDPFVALDPKTTLNKSLKKTFSAEYYNAFWSSFAEQHKTGKFQMTAMDEGTSAEGGYAVPVIVEDSIVPLAPLESSVRKVALTLVTASDIKFPIQATRSAANQKTESGDTQYTFQVTAPTLGQFTLTSYQNGAYVPVSIELLSDVSALAPFVTTDLSRAICNWEENMFWNGSGTGQPEGLLGNAGNTIAESLTTYGIDAFLDLTAEVNPWYYANASILCSRQTGIAFMKAQLALNQFQNFFSRVGTQDYLLGYPMNYSYEAPTFSASPSTTGVILFGDFKAAYVIGDRHTSAITTRVLTELGALQGVVNILGYRRTDGKVRRSEAYAQLNVTG
jgi:HK97 family phage major capsid protein